jgi:hypothetical protein
MEVFFMNFSIVRFSRGVRPAPMRAIAGSAAFATAALLLPPLPAQAPDITVYFQFPRSPE